MKRALLLSCMGVLLFLFSGCQSQEQGRPKVLGQENDKLVYAQRMLNRSTQPKTDELKLKKMELQTRKEIEMLHAEKELEIARLKAQSEGSKFQTEKEIALKKVEMERELFLGDQKIKGWMIVLATLFLFLLVWIAYKLFRDHQRQKLRLFEERLRHEKELQERELQARITEKMIEALGSGNLSEVQQQKLLESFSGSNRNLPMKQ
ncbi:hypothetical protein [Hydrogenimonas cancrithermarum]|uniref:Uncharacterized protein n=1 Tax=Hydrogenimonas cancrithermarum TaxID=2993563 RepID=A0ABN6WVQ9_9BACT|nr:hypothetical protein [Hydrogenimonas cancrithermarum]BDY13077.1 hypothetical protein HCR_13890 [Hydrogenimonas cancrithermarum]